jgi:YggT family protein
MCSSPKRRRSDSRLAASIGADPVGILCALITVFIVLLFVRAVLSWFPVQPGSGVAQLSRLLIELTDWAVRPLRRIIPPAGMFDLSFMVLVFFLFILRGAIGC